MWRIPDYLIPIYLPCHIHLEETTHPKPTLQKKLSIHPIDPYYSRHETFEDWHDPKKEDRSCDEIENACDYEEDNSLYDDYLKLEDEELRVDAEEFVRKENVVEEVEASALVRESAPAEESAPVDIVPIEESLIEGEGEEFNPFQDLPKDMELVERRKAEAEVLLDTCKPFLENLAASETKETLDDQMLDHLQKFVALADEYFILTHPEVVKKKSIKYEYYFEDVPENRAVHKGRIVQSTFLHESVKKSIMLRTSINEVEKERINTILDQKTQEGMDSGIFKRNSKIESIMQVSQIKRPSEIFAELKLKRKESLLRKKKSIIRKILYPIEVSIKSVLF